MRLDDVIRPGPLTNYQLESIFLFADETRVVTFPLTGARLREVLEHGVSDGSLGKGGFLQVSGITFTLRPGRPAGAGSPDDDHAGPVAAPSRRPTPSRWPSRSIAACHGGDGYQVPEAGARLRPGRLGAAGGGPAAPLRGRFAEGPGSAPTAPARIRETGKHKSRLSDARRDRRPLQDLITQAAKPKPLGPRRAML